MPGLLVCVFKNYLRTPSAGPGLKVRGWRMLGNGPIHADETPDSDGEEEGGNSFNMSFTWN